MLLIDYSDLDNFINEKMIESTHFSKNINVSTNGQAGLDFVEGFVTSNADNGESNLDCMFVDLNMPLMGDLNSSHDLKRYKPKAAALQNYYFNLFNRSGR